jgi:hypothetical protein
MELFKGRHLLIATKHHKESVIAPILEKELGVICHVVKGFDTDELGTFTGEVERKLDPLKTAKEKCMRAAHIGNIDLVIASEGSFGPHPSLFFVPVDDELLVLIDLKNKLEFIVREVSTDTNFAAQTITTKSELRQFAKQHHFPSHALILKKSEQSSEHLLKGILDDVNLETHFEKLVTIHGSVYVETDMRAMYNPSRMQVIEKATQKLINLIKTFCPECHTPGFRIIDAKKGLPCEWCQNPTQSILSHIYACQKCDFINEKLFPFDKQTEDPMYCDHCNP